MADRIVTYTRKGYAGDILTLCNPKEQWFQVFKYDAIKEIEEGTNKYFVEVDGNKISVIISFKHGSKRLITDKNFSLKNILGELENC